MPELIIAVFDTNILIRLALSKTKAIARLWEAFRSHTFEIVVSDLILTELERVLRYPRIAKHHG